MGMALGGTGYFTAMCSLRLDFLPARGSFRNLGAVQSAPAPADGTAFRDAGTWQIPMSVRNLRPSAGPDHEREPPLFAGIQRHADVRPACLHPAASR